VADNRSDANFLSRQLFMVDIDSGMQISDLEHNAFYQACAAGYYATPSYRPEAERFRIMFRTETPIYNAKLARLLIAGLMREFDHSDPSCKDSTRIFFGTVQCSHRELRDNTLADEIVAELIARELQIWGEQHPPQEPVEYPELSDHRRQRILDLLKITFVGEYQQWRDIGYGLKAGGFSFDDYAYVTQGLMREKTRADAQKIWDKAQIQSEGIHLGSVIHFLRQRHGEDCLREKPTIIQNNWHLKDYKIKHTLRRLD
jgi:hypothetical protein